jgi:4-hydroxybenzoate polyprenyltransferase
LVAALTVGALGYASAGGAWPAAWRSVSVWLVLLGGFALLRIADEFKDANEDAAHRPYRPVPRGLVTLRELGWVAVGIGLVQLGLSWLLGPPLLWALLLFWVLWALMRREFFMPVWLKGHPLLYMLAHMLILPVMMGYALAAAHSPGAALTWGLLPFLAASYANGVVFEIGRKLRAPVDEESGVDTYSLLWGTRRAVGAWAGALIAAAALAWGAAQAVGVGGPFALVAGLGVSGAAWAAASMLHQPTTAHSRRIERISALWVLGCYLALGLLWMVR